MSDVIIRNARIVDHRGVYRAGIVIKDGKVERIGSEESLPSGDRTIDARDNFVLPGIVDPHLHLGSGMEIEKEILTETRAAATGGVTTIITLLRERYRESGETLLGPYLAKRERLEQIVRANASVDVTFNVGIENRQHVQEIPRYAEEMGLTSFKFTKGYRPHFADDGMIYLGMNIIRDLGAPCVAMVHCENLDIVEILRAKMIEDGRTDLPAYTEAAPGFCEAEVMSRMLYLAKVTGCPLYIPHTTIAEGLELAAEYKAKGLAVTVETCPHYLTFTKDSPLGPLAMVNPPLREKRDQAALWWGLRNGVVDCVGSDHVTNLRRQKPAMFRYESPGFPGVATTLPVLLSEGVNKSRLSLERLVEVCCLNPAKAFGLYPRKGVLQIGSDADLVIVDLHRKVKITPEILHSASDYTLYDGWELEGWPLMTLVRGNVVTEDGEIVGKPGLGRFISRELERKEPHLSLDK